MATVTLPSDFKEFLRLLNASTVEYLVIGGYAVGYYGYARATADIDVWVAVNPETAGRLVDVLKQFGFDLPELQPAIFLRPDMFVRMGMPPFRIEISTGISGVDFDACFARRVIGRLDGIDVNLISLEDLIANKKASGRPKDIDDVEHLT